MTSLPPHSNFQEPRNNDSLVVKALKAWRDYPMIFFEKARKDPARMPRYMFENVSCNFLEGYVAFGSALEWMTDNSASYLVGFVFVGVARRVQFYRYISRERGKERGNNHDDK